MIALATLADLVLFCLAGAVLVVGYCALCDLLDEAIGRLWRGIR